MSRLLTLLLGAALLAPAAFADTPEPEKTMTARKTEKTLSKTDCDASAKPHKGNGGISRGPNAKAVGGSGNVGRDTGNGGIAIGANADASGGDDNIADKEPCDGKTRLGNGGTARGPNARANGGSGNVVKF